MNVLDLLSQPANTIKDVAIILAIIYVFVIQHRRLQLWKPKELEEDLKAKMRLAEERIGNQSVEKYKEVDAKRKAEIMQTVWASLLLVNVLLIAVPKSNRNDLLEFFLNSPSLKKAKAEKAGRELVVFLREDILPIIETMQGRGS